MDKKLEIALELTRLVFDANSRGLRLKIEMFDGGKGVSIADISDLYISKTEKWKYITVGNASFDERLSEEEPNYESNYKLSELPKVVKEYIENNTK